MGKTETAEHDCSNYYWLDSNDLDIEKVDHPENCIDLPNTVLGGQSYQVYRCKQCGRYHGIRHQWNAGTGCDDHHKAFGFDPKEVKRHY